MEEILKVTDLKKVYGKRGAATTALNGVSFSLRGGEYVGIMGASGSGKTTLLNCVSTIDRPTSGSILVDGKELSDLRGKELARFRRERLGFIFQDFNLLDTLTAYENISLALSIQKRSASEIDTAVKTVAQQLGITEVLQKYPYQMSGGQKQRVAIARALVNNPKVLLLDEPLSALDGVIKESIKDRIKTIAREYHLTTIIVTHDPEEALTLSDRVLIIDQGSISQYAKPDEIVHQPRNDFVRKFILRQLEIKRGNIYALFGDRPQLAGEAV